MIQVIDKLQYLPKSRKKQLIDENQVLNLAYKKAVEALTEKLRTLPTQGQQVLVTFVGQVRSGDNEIKAEVEAVDESLRANIEVALGTWMAQL